MTEPEAVPAEPIEPEPAQDDKADKPDWVNDMQDIIDGKYDSNTKEANRLLDAALAEADSPDCDPRWAERFDQAEAHMLVIGKKRAAKFA